MNIKYVMDVIDYRIYVDWYSYNSGGTFALIPKRVNIIC